MKDRATREARVVDETERDTTVPVVRYDITSYGADFDVDGLVKRLDRGDIATPDWQRSYVWKLPEASRFVESLLLGLPVPGIFLALEPKSNRYLVIDGQQRLKTLSFFCEGHFDPKPGEKRQRVFALADVQPPFNGMRYKDLEEKDRRKLDDAIIHATVVRQDAPPGDDTSIYHIFERLNSSGRRLSEQEIRRALYHGPLMDMITQLNDHEPWRRIAGKKSTRLKDEELILRFLALLESSHSYARPMKEFLTQFAGRNKHATPAKLDSWAHLFQETVDALHTSVGEDSFRRTGSLNAAIFDSVMVGLARRMGRGKPPEHEALRIAYWELLEDGEFESYTTRSTADAPFVQGRLDLATEKFNRV